MASESWHKVIRSFISIIAVGPRSVRFHLAHWGIYPRGQGRWALGGIGDFGKKSGTIANRLIQNSVRYAYGTCTWALVQMHSVDRNAASSMGRADGRKPVKMQSAISDYTIVCRNIICKDCNYASSIQLSFFLSISFHTWTLIMSIQVSPATSNNFTLRRPFRRQEIGIEAEVTKVSETVGALSLS